MPVEVLLKILRNAALLSGHRIVAAGLSAANLNISPLISRYDLSWTGVAMSSLLLVTIRSRHQVLPVAGSNDDTDSPVQTINCRLPPASMMIGELLETESSSAFQTSLPEFLSKATTHAPGFPPTKTIRRLPSTNGEARHLSTSTSYCLSSRFSQIKLPLLESKQMTCPLPPNTKTFPDSATGVAEGPVSY